MAESSQKASLGCGTLILIALIVMIFSHGGDDKKLRSEISGLRTEIQNLSTKVGAAPAGMDELKQEIQALGKAVGVLRESLDGQRSEISALKSVMPKPGAGFEPVESDPDVEAKEAKPAPAPPRERKAPASRKPAPSTPPHPGLPQETLPLEED
jgi:hypothetical protein